MPSNEHFYTIGLDDEYRQRLDELKATYGKQKWCEVFDLAIRLLTWAETEEQAGRRIGSMTEHEPGAGTFKPLDPLKDA